MSSKITLSSWYPLYHPANVLASRADGPQNLNSCITEEFDFRMDKSLHRYVHPLLLQWGDPARFISFLNFTFKEFSWATNGKEEGKLGDQQSSSKSIGCPSGNVFSDGNVCYPSWNVFSDGSVGYPSGDVFSDRSVGYLSENVFSDVQTWPSRTIPCLGAKLHLLNQLAKLAAAEKLFINLLGGQLSPMPWWGECFSSSVQAPRCILN